MDSDDAKALIAAIDRLGSTLAGIEERLAEIATAIYGGPRPAGL